ncbi:MAG: hypothetical protein WAN04_03190, partial [Candidatus Udaeobacter sp.]
VIHSAQNAIFRVGSTSKVATVLDHRQLHAALWGARTCPRFESGPAAAGSPHSKKPGITDAGYRFRLSKRCLRTRVDSRTK